ncbi:MAG: HAMP domain-containing histidine kinase [Bacteroidales bacterium]|nr:HAMP domain-containing histidine kinase [Bacteroidales bacterium]
MKKRNTAQLLGIFSIVILILVQIFIIRGVWKQKDEMFNLRYRMLSQEALTAMSRRWNTDGFDTARYILSEFSRQIVREVAAISNDSVLNEKKKDILEFVTDVLNEEQFLSYFLSGYFERQGFEKDFNHKIIVNYFELIDFDTRIPIYVSEEYASRRPLRTARPESGQVQGPGSGPGSGAPPPGMGRRQTSEILVRDDRSEDNNYRLDFEYYIDFSDKQKVILKETSASLVLSILSILVVATLFLITYRNLMEEKRLSDLKTDFINNMTHELKTPLSTITVAGRTLEMEKIRSDDSKILETAKLIGKQSVHLNQLINMILEISMWERTQFELDKRKIPVEELMNDIVGSFKTGSGSSVSLMEKYHLEGVKADLDIVYFTTLINNLLSNAVKYSDKDPVIEIEGFKENNSIMIRVADNGIGISKNDQKHVFDKFYRASSGNVHKYKGLGLGLYYVKRIAEAHGGDVSVASKPGKGSIFTVTIPYE